MRFLHGEVISLVYPFQDASKAEDYQLKEHVEKQLRFPAITSGPDVATISESSKLEVKVELITDGWD
ncbi:hypothetical protein AMELA_G00055080 [Ameiurus melas]|uniref:Uncharacterized protein n=1 Tax=Ameiurus melas TaxID=219545 RepID=A0A7J6B6F0_AMEME|nr:hypothetical protein AMELA_G00055080 [Ameiurus melas]